MLCEQKLADLDIRCMTEHPGFEAVCLNEYVLETAYYSYRQHHGQHDGNLTE